METNAHLPLHRALRVGQLTAFSDVNGLNQRKCVSELSDNGTIVSIE